MKYSFNLHYVSQPDLRCQGLEPTRKYCLHPGQLAGKESGSAWVHTRVQAQSRFQKMLKFQEQHLTEP